MSTTHETANDLQIIKKLLNEKYGFDDNDSACVNSIRQKMVDLVENFGMISECKEVEKNPEKMSKLKAYIGVTAFCGLTEIYVENVKELIKNVDNKEHSRRLMKIELRVEYVRNTLGDCSERQKKLEEILDKIMSSDDNACQGRYIEFDYSFDVIKNKLTSCTEQLDKAKEELEEGFDSIKKYIRTCKSDAKQAKSITIAHGVGLAVATVCLLPLIGFCLSTGTELHKSLKVGQTLNKSLEDADNIKGNYDQFDIVIGHLHLAISKMKSMFDEHGNAKKVKEHEEKLQCMETQSKEKDKNIETLEERNKDLETQHLKDQEKIKQLTELSSHSKP